MALTICACADLEGDIDEGTPLIHTNDKTIDSAEIEVPARTASGAPHQITIRDEHDALDPNDPTVLQVNAPAGKSRWVSSGAQALVAASGGDPSDIVTVVTAQRLLATIARADATAIVEVIAVSEQQASGLYEVSFAASSTIHGSLPATRWTAQLAEGACAQATPEVGSRWLALVQTSDDAVALRRDNPLLPLDAGSVMIDGSKIELEHLQLALAAAEDEP
jgi:hypothetical protein